MTEQTYFEQFVGDDEIEVIDTIPAFSPDCPECHGTGFKQTRTGDIVLETMCYRCFDLAGR